MDTYSNWLKSTLYTKCVNSHYDEALVFTVIKNQNQIDIYIYIYIYIYPCIFH
jgi:hypothetical protein